MRWLVAFIWLILASYALGDTPDQIIAKNTRSIVFLQVEDAAGGVLTSGTGFIVSRNGYVLTVADLMPKQSQKLWAVIGQREGVRYSLEPIAVDDQADVVLLKLPQSQDCRYAVTLSTVQVKLLDHVLALGFPGKEGLTPSTLSISNVSSQVGNYKTNGYLPEGDRGGPVFNEAGQVIAIVQGGTRPGTENNDLIPITPAIALIRTRGVQAGVDAPVPSDSSCTPTVSSYQPEIALSRVNFDATADPRVEARWPISWVAKNEGAAKDDTVRTFSIPLRNIGLGPAKTIAVLWSFPIQGIVDDLNRKAQRAHIQADFSFNKTFLVVKSEVFGDYYSLWENQRRRTIDYLLSGLAQAEPVNLQLPDAYILATSAHLYLSAVIADQSPESG